MRALLILSLCALPAAAAPQGLSGPEAAALIAAAMAKAGVAAEPPASLRPLPPCTHPPRVTPLQGNWTTAELTCDAPRWKRALRTRAPVRHDPSAATAETAHGPTAALRRPLAKGATIARADLALHDGAPPALLDAYAGRKLRVALAPGQQILPRHLEPDWLVSRGGPVALRVAVGAIEVLAPGEALSDGALGDLVEIRNLSSGATVRATVTARNMAEVRPNMR